MFGASGEPLKDKGHALGTWCQFWALGPFLTSTIAFNSRRVYKLTNNFPTVAPAWTAMSGPADISELQFDAVR